VSATASAPLPRRGHGCRLRIRVLHHIPDWQRALAEIARVLKTGGILLLRGALPALYQNVITRGSSSILLRTGSAAGSPTGNEGRRTLSGASLENRWLGILGFAVKR